MSRREVISFLPGGGRDIYVVDVGSDDGVAVGDRGVFRCSGGVFEVTYTEARRSKLEIGRDAAPAAGEKRLRVALGGARPEAWCPEGVRE